MSLTAELKFGPTTDWTLDPDPGPYFTFTHFLLAAGLDHIQGSRYVGKCRLMPASESCGQHGAARE